MKTGQKILDYMNAHDIQQATLAAQCGWTKQKVHYILHGKNRMSLDDYILIRDTLGVPFATFGPEEGVKQ